MPFTKMPKVIPNVLLTETYGYKIKVIVETLEQIVGKTVFVHG